MEKIKWSNIKKLLRDSQHAIIVGDKYIGDGTFAVRMDMIAGKKFDTPENAENIIRQALPKLPIKMVTKEGMRELEKNIPAKGKYYYSVQQTEAYNAERPDHNVVVFQADDGDITKIRRKYVENLGLSKLYGLRADRPMADSPDPNIMIMPLI